MVVFWVGGVIELGFGSIIFLAKQILRQNKETFNA
jgi:hypothetical protein